VLPACSLPQREGNRADGQKQKQETRTSNKMRFSDWVNLFSHFCFSLVFLFKSHGALFVLVVLMAKRVFNKSPEAIFCNL
jgi:hypothetical protein